MRRARTDLPYGLLYWPDIVQYEGSCGRTRGGQPRGLHASPLTPQRTSRLSKTPNLWTHIFFKKRHDHQLWPILCYLTSAKGLRARNSVELPLTRDTFRGVRRAGFSRRRSGRGMRHFRDPCGVPVAPSLIRSLGETRTYSCRPLET
jgi:hypothetical protein